MPFKRCVNEWNDLYSKYKQKIKYYVGLAVYRIGEKVDETKKYSDLGWQKKDGTILKQQVIYCKDNLQNYAGYCLYDYKTIFDKDGNRTNICFEDIENLKNIEKAK